MDYIGFDKENHFDGFSFYCGDCMELLKQTPDKYYDLCIVDPPYRDSIDNQPTKDMRNNGSMDNFGDKPTSLYFEELFRVSHNQIIWGANNFALPTYKGFVVWKKLTISDKFTMSMAEIAYISEGLGTVSKIFECAPQGKRSDPRIHPTPKPIALYSWLIHKYAKKGDKILDTHLGSASIALAIDKANKADGMELDFVGIELDKDYFDSAMKRFSKGRQQMFLNLNVE